MSMEVYSQVPIAQTDLGLMTLKTGVAGKTVRIRTLCISLASNGTIQLKSGATGLTGAIAVLASVPFVIHSPDYHAQDAALAGPEGGGIDLVTTQIANGFAILSTN